MRAATDSFTREENAVRVVYVASKGSKMWRHPDDQEESATQTFKAGEA